MSLRRIHRKPLRESRKFSVSRRSRRLNENLSLSEGFKKFADLTLEKRQIMGYNSRKYAEKHLTREVNLQMVCDALLRVKHQYGEP